MHLALSACGRSRHPLRTFLCLLNLNQLLPATCRARAAQMHLVRSAYGCGRSGSSAADDASDTLQQVIDTLAGYK